MKESRPTFLIWPAPGRCQGPVIGPGTDLPPLFASTPQKFLGLQSLPVRGLPAVVEKLFPSTGDVDGSNTIRLAGIARVSVLGASGPDVGRGERKPATPKCNRTHRPTTEKAIGSGSDSTQPCLSPPHGQIPDIGRHKSMPHIETRGSTAK